MTEKAEQRSGLYWFCRHTRSGIGRFMRRHRLAFVILLLLGIYALFMSRSTLHPVMLGLRKNLFLILLLGPFLLFVRSLIRRKNWKRLFIWGLVFTLLFVGLAFFGKRLHHYLSLYYRYQTLELSMIESLPLSDHERIQPLHSVYSLAHEVMTESESPTIPDFVRVDDEYRWTMAIEPAYPVSKILGSIKEVMSVPGTTPSPNFAREHRTAVDFTVGENLRFGRSTRVSVIRRMTPWRYFNYEPSNIAYLQDDQGEWVQVVSLIRWKGILFVRPEFGGVQVIRQGVGNLERMFIGCGEWIKPQDIPKHEYLMEQNILSYEVSRYIARSFQFAGGFMAPLPGYHKGDIRIPDLPEDVNNQPFTGYYTLPDDESGQLYHYFALEPFDEEKQGLNTSLWVPADGSKEIMVYRHHEQGGALTGVSAISAKVMESRKEYDWSRNRPVEHRPYIKEMDGRTRFFWLTTVVTFKESDDGKRKFIAGSVPDVVLTDAEYNTPVWVNPLDRSEWNTQIQDQLKKVWTPAR